VYWLIGILITWLHLSTAILHLDTPYPIYSTCAWIMLVVFSSLVFNKWAHTSVFAAHDGTMRGSSVLCTTLQVDKLANICEFSSVDLSCSCCLVQALNNSQTTTFVRSTPKLKPTWFYFLLIRKKHWLQAGPCHKQVASSSRSPLLVHPKKFNPYSKFSIGYRRKACMKLQRACNTVQGCFTELQFGYLCSSGQSARHNRGNSGLLFWP